MFELDPRLAENTSPITTLGLSRVLLMNDARYPWVVLVPQKPGLKELHDLEARQREQLTEEIAMVSLNLERLFRPDKINIASLGNVVPQLHIHVVVRRKADIAWPGPVWGHGKREPYALPVLENICKKLAIAFTQT